MPVSLKRAYAPAEASDGARILVDRLWPRGVSKEHLQLKEWLKDVSPSSELRHFLHADPSGHWQDFKRYEAELQQEPAAAAFERLRELAKTGHVTLVYGVKDEEHNQAVVLQEMLNAHAHRHARHKEEHGDGK